MYIYSELDSGERLGEADIYIMDWLLWILVPGSFVQS